MDPLFFILSIGHFSEPEICYFVELILDQDVSWLHISVYDPLGHQELVPVQDLSSDLYHLFLGEPGFLLQSLFQGFVAELQEEIDVVA